MDSVKVKLMEAISKGNYEEVKKLLRTYESRSILSITRDKEEYSFLLKAVTLKYPLITKLLLDKFKKVKFQALIGRPLLFTAVENQDIETVRVLLDHGADANFKQYVSKDEKAKSYTVLHTAVKQGDLEIVKLLVNHGADVNLKDENGTASVHTAFEGKFFEILMFLVDNGADIDVKNRREDTLLHTALKNESWEMAKYLIEKGADVNIHRKYCDTPLYTALYNPRLEIVKLLVAKGANINSHSHLGRYPIHNAIRKLEILKYFLEMGVDINALDYRKNTPLLLAATLCYSDKAEQIEIIKYLLQNGAQLHSTDTDDFLTIAQKSDPEVLKLILKHSTAFQFTGSNAYDYYHSIPRLESAVLLVEHGVINLNSRFYHKGKRNTALQHLSGTRFVDLAIRLLNAGADNNKVSKYQFNKNSSLEPEISPLYIAMFEKREKLVSLYLNRGADVNILPTHNSDFQLQEYFKKKTVNEIFVKHIVTLKHQNSEVDDRLLEFVNRNAELSKFYKKCDEEMETIKNRKFNDTSLTYLKILTTKRINQLEAFARNEDVLKGMRSRKKTYEAKFPIYGPDVTQKLKVGIERKKVMEQSAKCQRILFRPIRFCIDQIFNYLSNEDIKVLIEVCEPLRN